MVTTRHRWPLLMASASPSYLLRLDCSPFFPPGRLPPPFSLPSLLTTTCKKLRYDALSNSQTAVQTSLGFGGVLAPLNRTRNGPKGVKAHLRPKPKESSQTKTNTHTHDHRAHLGLKEKAQ